MPAKVLYVSGSLGLGHITRDLAIARELRLRQPGIDIWWLAGEPAGTLLQEAGERLHPLAGAYRSDTPAAESVAGEGELNLLRYAFKASRAWLTNVQVVRRAPPPPRGWPRPLPSTWAQRSAIRRFRLMGLAG